MLNYDPRMPCTKYIVSIVVPFWGYFIYMFRIAHLTKPEQELQWRLYSWYIAYTCIIQVPPKQMILSYLAGPIEHATDGDGWLLRDWGCWALRVQMLKRKIQKAIETQPSEGPIDRARNYIAAWIPIYPRTDVTWPAVLRRETRAPAWLNGFSVASDLWARVVRFRIVHGVYT